MIKSIGFITTARSDYNTMRPVMQLAQKNMRVNAQIFCAGMHLVPCFGNTWRQLEKDGIKITEKIDFLDERDTRESFANALGEGVKKFTKTFIKNKPNFICVSGDRIENLSAFVSATTLGIPIAHMCGGDITEGAIDNQIRHVMTKLSHLHFVSMEQHARRVIQMGEEPWRVVVTGDAAIDIIKKTKRVKRSYLETTLGLDQGEQFFISIFHPQTLGKEKSEAQYKNLLTAIRNVKARPLFIYPNIDPGFKPLRQMLDDFCVQRPDAIRADSFETEIFYGLLEHANFLIGNSSTGIWEAPSFQLPAINIGERQKGRMRGENVIDCSGMDAKAISLAISKAQSINFQNSLKGITNPYGDGNAAKKIISKLISTPINDRLFIKKFHEI